jgi:hypothetical protein
MKYRYLAIAGISLVSGWNSGIAQTASEATASEPPAAREQGPRHMGLARFLESLPPETRKRFEAAREKALQNPKLQELRQVAESAKKDFLKAMRERMLEIDPGLAEIVKKRAGERKSWKEGGGFENLSEDERQKLTSAREKAENDVAVRAAEEKKREASEEYREVLREAMIKHDPSVAPLLEKMAYKPPSAPNPADAKDPATKEPQAR